MRAAACVLARALEARGARVLSTREWPWASVTFEGARHRLRLAVPDARILAGIEEAAFDLEEHLLADLVVEERDVRGDCLMVTIEALTIEDRRDALAEAGEPGTKPSVVAKAPAFAGARPGWKGGRGEPAIGTACGTNPAFVPLAAA